MVISSFSRRHAAAAGGFFVGPKRIRPLRGGVAPHLEGGPSAGIVKPVGVSGKLPVVRAASGRIMTFSRE
jgi:hypothetical protein